MLYRDRLPAVHGVLEDGTKYPKGRKRQGARRDVSEWVLSKRRGLTLLPRNESFPPVDLSPMSACSEIEKGVVNEEEMAGGGGITFTFLMAAWTSVLIILTSCLCSLNIIRDGTNQIEISSDDTTMTFNMSQHLSWSRANEPNH